MKIGVLSDSHDHIPNLARAVHLAASNGAGLLIHCGDLISPFMLPYLARFPGPVHLVYGNNVGDQHLISSRCQHRFANLTHHGIQASLEIQGCRIGVHHYPELAKGLAATGQYDIVCCGHDHKAAIQDIDGCLLVDPGDLLGKDDPPGFMLVDLESRQVQHIIVGERLVIDVAATP